MTSAERVRASVESMQFDFEGQKFKVTISGGVALKIQETTWQKVIQEADEALYFSKSHGRNQIKKA